ncbi:MAG: hypothetical protein MO846_00280 [Candidatus Devosia symbiotica]|nr:hypothetical protein [Candidatus Devosia symbiotica]
MQRQNDLGFGPFTPVVRLYRERPFVTINTDDACAAGQAGIVNPQIRVLSVVGALDQVSDLTPLIEDPMLSHAMI